MIPYVLYKLLVVWHTIHKEQTMSAYERRALVSLLATLLLAVVFLGYVLPR